MIYIYVYVSYTRVQRNEEPVPRQFFTLYFLLNKKLPPLLHVDDEPLWDIQQYPKYDYLICTCVFVFVCFMCDREREEVSREREKRKE